MNLRNILLAERDKTQVSIRHLQRVVDGIDKLIEHWDAIAPPGSERAPNSVVLDAPPADAPKVVIIPPAPQETRTPEGRNQAAPDELTHAQLCLRWGCNATRVKNLKYTGKLIGGPGVVTLASVEAYEQKKAERKPTKAAPEPRADEMSVADAASVLGVTVSRIGQMVKEGKLVRVRHGVLDRPSVVSMLDKRKGVAAPLAKEAAGAPVKSTAKPIAKPEKPAKEKRPFDEPKPIVKDLPAPGPWNPQQTVKDRYVSMEAAAKELNCNLDWLRTVKKSGRIYGAPDWINMTQLEAYLKHPDFDPPLIDRAQGKHEKLAAHHY